MRVPEDNAGDGSHTSKPACRLEEVAVKLAWGRSLTSWLQNKYLFVCQFPRKNNIKHT